MQSDLNVTRGCITKSFYESQFNSLINMSDYNYIRSASHVSTKLEIAIKILLCLISICASLFGNLMVFYLILIKPRMKSKSNEYKHFEHEIYPDKCKVQQPQQQQQQQQQQPDVAQLDVQYQHIFVDQNSAQQVNGKYSANRAFAGSHLDKHDSIRSVQLKLDKHENKTLYRKFEFINRENSSSFVNNPVKGMSGLCGVSGGNSGLGGIVINGSPCVTPVNGAFHDELAAFNEKSDIVYNSDIRHDKKLIITRIYKPYRNKPVNLFILNLCFCDLMIVLWCSWVHMVNSVSENWLMGAFFCKFNTFIQVMSLIAAISTLCVISFERFKGIVCSMRRKLNRRDSINIILIIWMFSFIAAMPIFIHRKQFRRVWKDHDEIWCSDEWPRFYKFHNNTDCVESKEEPLRRVYYTFISLVLFFVPIVIMLFCYCLIMRKLNKTKILKYFQENSLEKNILNRRRQKVNILLIGLLVSFMICWSPAQGFILYEAYKKSNNTEMPFWFNWFYFLVYLLAYSNSAINPIIYAGLNKFYREELRKIFNSFVRKNTNIKIATCKKMANQQLKMEKMNSYD